MQSITDDARRRYVTVLRDPEGLSRRVKNGGDQIGRIKRFLIGRKRPRRCNKTWQIKNNNRQVVFRVDDTNRCFTHRQFLNRRLLAMRTMTNRHNRRFAIFANPLLQVGIVIRHAVITTPSLRLIGRERPAHQHCRGNE